MSGDANFTITLNGTVVTITIAKKQTMIPIRSIVKIEIERMKCNSTFIKIHTQNGAPIDLITDSDSRAHTTYAELCAQILAVTV